ncbi:DNA processing protein [Amycolatopsis arida]|uniref:DNA processing protein n=1 Tax=Amycolatopsis arida TaxID=587909 RepID=A0A1I5KIB2_9PSEU|nr:hypothetical protein [Amycolatopsis arida]TDX97061.1 hypothetical protein CLV69_102163 [Amycolatopsis arida]SFO84780.1 DNA processing protein [Amycolatopsis arida]
MGGSDREVVAEFGVPLVEVGGLLPALELDGFAERCSSGWWHASGQTATVLEWADP